MNIQQVPDLRAVALATAPLQNDRYHFAIRKAAETLLSNPPLSQEATENLFYRTQYASGATLWEHPRGTTVIVRADGTIDTEHIV